jgi:hypothetical protein
VDHHSDHVYVFLMRDLTLDETILAKHAYERFLSSIGVTSKAIMLIMGNLLTRDFVTTSLLVIKSLLSAA